MYPCCREIWDLGWVISKFLSYIKRDAKMNSRKCEVCNINVHRASYVKLLRSGKHLENEKQLKMIIPEWLFQQPNENKIRNIYKPKSLNLIVRDNIKLDDKQLNKELAKITINAFYFTDRALKVGFKINLHSHHINHVNSKSTITTNYP